ncbi:MAG: hypothetical protein R3Y51_06075 [Rikenellaceae bacterium]
MQSGLRCDSICEKRTHSIVMSFSGNVYTGDIYKLDLEDDSVKTEHIDDGAITTVKIENNSITIDKLDSEISDLLSNLSADGVYVKAELNDNDNYVVNNIIYAKDFVIANSDGTLSELSSTFIDDSSSSSSTTWSSSYLYTLFANKSDIDHTHSEYSLTSHTHSDYSLTTHTHSEYADIDHSHDDEYLKLDDLESSVIEATLDNEMYTVKNERAIISSDFFATGGDLYEITNDQGSSILNDTIISASTTWSSTYIDTLLDDKSNINHTHNEYSLISHTHSDYSLSSHTHSEYSLTSHTHNEYAEIEHSHSSSDITDIDNFWNVDNLPIRSVDDEVIYVKDIVALGY